jgi:hypothetical protein
MFHCKHLVLLSLPGIYAALQAFIFCTVLSFWLILHCTREFDGMALPAFSYLVFGFYRIDLNQLNCDIYQNITL